MVKRSFFISAIIACLVFFLAALLTASSITSGGVATGVWQSGSGAPSGAIGNNNDFYIDLASGILWGPKSAGAWGEAGWKWSVFPLAAWVQSNGNTTTLASITVAYSTNVVAGNTLIATVEEAAFGYGALTISDTQVNSWTLTSQIIGGASNFPRVSVYRATANASGANSVTVGGMATQNPPAVVLAEVQGIPGAPSVQATSIGTTGVLSVTATIAQRAFAFLSCATAGAIGGSGTATFRTQATAGGWTGGIGTQNIIAGFGSQAVTMTGPGGSNNTACALNAWYY